ncbi:MAG: ATP-binding protein, partial [Sinobacteraceae bacterium]|nr:ATP-binding protein [Nevskiaceae bacterium]
MAQSAVILSINEKNLLKNLKYTFTTGHQFIAELMQNARRSGSPEIRISVTAVDDDKSDVFVCDEGRGIEDMQSLFTVAGSDWDTDIQDAEQPFGMGFVSALFAAPKITVRSNGAQLTCRTDEIFAGAQVPVESTGHDQNGGTEICLYGVPMLAGQLRGAVEKYASGFPIPVTLDGKPVHRAFAADSGIQYIQTPIGLLGLEDGKTLETLKELPSSNSVRTLLQGLPIDTNGNSCYGWDAIRTWVLHLDTQQFKPRMPDRGSVMDAERACEHIRGTVKGILIDELARRLAQLGPEAFVQQHADMACRLAPELMNA